MTEVSEKNDAVEYRVADGNDGTGILAVLQEVAPEIPVLLDTSEREEAMKTIIVDCCDSGESWVALDAGGEVVGFVLAKPNHLERFQHRNQAVSVRYVGVSKARRGEGISGALMEKLKAKGGPLTASVLHGNRSGMADRLSEMGFVAKGSDAKEARLRWAAASSK